MNEQDAVIVRTAFLMKKLAELKQLQAVIEQEKVKIADSIKAHVNEIIAVRSELSRFMASDGVVGICELIGKLNLVIDYERKVCDGSIFN